MESKVEFVGVATNMPGTSGGFTMAAFKADEVPPGTRLYVQAPLKWNTHDPILENGKIKEYIVAVHRQRIPGLTHRFIAYYSTFSPNPTSDMDDEDAYLSGWYQILDDEYVPLLREGDVLRGWMEFPTFSE